MVKFDNKGHLTPYEIIEVSLQEFATYFVENLEDKEHRRELWLNYVRYLEDLQKIINVPFYQWVGGSFVTQKRFPKDIDIVNFVDFRLVEANRKLLKSLSYPISEKVYSMDAYFVELYPQSHKYYIRTQTDILFWKQFFQRTKPNRRRKYFPKGFVKIEFKNERV